MVIKFSTFEIRLEFGFFAMLSLGVLLCGDAAFYAVLLAALLHELGHGIVMCLFSVPPRSVVFSAGGVTIRPEARLLPLGQEALILLGGPFLNLLFAALVPASVWVTAAHLVLGIGNLLPCRLLDGGAFLDILLERFGKSFLGVWLHRGNAVLLLTAAALLLICGAGSVPLIGMLALLAVSEWMT